MTARILKRWIDDVGGDRRQRGEGGGGYSVFLVIHGISLKMINIIIIRQSKPHENSGFSIIGGGSGISLIFFKYFLILVFIAVTLIKN